MKILINICLFSLIYSLSAFGQTNNTLSGILLDKTSREPILSGSVELLRAQDSVYVDGTISNLKGEFSLGNLKAGRYILKVTYIGYLPLIKNISLNEKNPVTSLGELLLETNDILLKETIIEGKRPEMIVKNDTLEYDAASFKTAENAVVEDLLKKLPGVEVDKDGNITAQGKSVSKMFVNGKEFFADDPQVASKNMPADMVDKVQVYDRKSEMSQMTGFDMGDEETVINLSVRSNMMQGTIGTIQLGVGHDVQNDTYLGTDKEVRYSESAFVSHQQGSDRITAIVRANNNNNMGGADIMSGGGSSGGGGRGGARMSMSAGGSGGGGGSGISKSQNYMANFNKEFSPKLNMTGDIRYSKQERKMLSGSEQITFNQLSPQQEISSQNSRNSGDNISSNFRIDWNPNSKNTLVFRPNIRYNQNERTGLGFDKRINTNDNSVLLDSKSLTFSKGNTLGFGGNLDYSYKFSKLGRVLSISMSGNYNNSYSQPRNTTHYNDPVENEYTNQIAGNKSLSDNFSGTVSFVEPIGKNNYIQALYRYSFSETDSRNSTYNLNLFPPMDELLDDTAKIVTSQSRTTLRNTTAQRFGLNFKADREKYNLTFGFNVDLSDATNDTYQPATGSIPVQFLPPGFNGKIPVFTGDSLISSTPINVVNYSPTLNFRYIFGQRSNLRVVYEGDLNQPTADQLRDYPYININRPNDVTQGNPDLKPSYENNLRAEFDKYVQATQLMYRFTVSGSFTVNDIITITQLRQDSLKGNLTTYDNINGNWNVFLMGMFNKPLSKKFSAGNMLRAGFSNANSFISSQENTMKKNTTPENTLMKNTMKSRTVTDNLNFKFQPNDSLYFGVNGMVRYNKVTYTAVSDRNQNIFDYSLGANVLWSFLPGWTFDSDISCNWRNGYAKGYNISQTIWNAAIARQIFKKQSGTGSIKLQIFDILQDRKSISASQSASELQFSQNNVIPSYFMASFIYRFSIFPKSSFLRESDMTPRRFEGGPGGGRPPGGSGRRQF